AAAQTPAQQGASQLQKFQKELRALNPKARLMVFGHYECIGIEAVRCGMACDDGTIAVAENHESRFRVKCAQFFLKFL
ncbi:alpha/beta hydrolase, partial [Corynebacterium diphtheriae]|uniref:alpha/beta hydrolase n=1 Tax=Corynebacterium diphtheriae TaxID=1717 RepID=UPI001FD3B7C2